ncbi:MAG: hypothetical protein ACLR0U_05955 [Enterocloster clostridioformis]
MTVSSRVLCTAIMGIMVVAVCWQVTTRYILNNPSTSDRGGSPLSSGVDHHGGSSLCLRKEEATFH